MKIIAIKTRKVTIRDNDLLKFLDKYLKVPQVPIQSTPGVETKSHLLTENSVLVITSKIVSITQGRVVKITEKTNKDALIKKEAEYYLPRGGKYHSMIAIKNHTIVGAAGIDESNGNGYYILLPENVQEVANTVREFLVKKFKLKHVGVIITDSRSVPLRRGAIGVALAHSGFSALNNYIGKKDIFGRTFKLEVSNIADTLAVAAVGVMGEGKEQTPLAIIEDVPFVQFQARNPSKEELQELNVELEDDVFYPVIGKAGWIVGEGK